MVFDGLRSTKPKNFRPKSRSTRCHTPPKDSTARPSVPRTDYDCRSSHVPYMPHASLALWRHGWRHPHSCWPIGPIRPGLTRIRTISKKKKMRENTLIKWTFDHDQKIKIFKTDLSHSIFRVHSDFGTRFFIRNSEIVQTSNFQKSWLLCKCWPNVKIFEMDLSCSIFRVHSDFGVRSIIWDSEIAQMAQIPRQLTFMLKST